MVTEETYFTQWYNLPPEYRKMILTFQCQTQRSHQLKAFKMYPLNLNTFAKALNIVYSVNNLQRTNLRNREN